MSKEAEEEILAKKHIDESIVMDLKMKKSRCKAAFTRAINRFKEQIDDEIENDVAKALFSKIEETMEIASASVRDLCEFFRKTNRTDDMVKVLSEIDLIDKKYEEVTDLYHTLMENSVTEGSVKGEESETDKGGKKQLGSDLWKQLKRVTIPVFNGDKTKYPSWKAAFYSCIDDAPSTPEYKLLQLRQYLGGSALAAIDNLGHSAHAYDAAKDRLERKFGGVSRIVNRFLDELENFRPIRNENVKELEKFADLLDVAVINLKDVKHLEDLKDGSLYHRLLKKLPQSMLTRYNRHVHEKDLTESVDTLRSWVNDETEYAIKASETINGLSYNDYRNKSRSTYHINCGDTSMQSCSFGCEESHKIWNCPNFKKLSVNERWETAKRLKLCFRCLKSNHQGNKCRFQGKCGINNCGKTHNRLLHSEVLNATAEAFQPANEKVFSANTGSNLIALRTIPVILKTRNRELKINALLDDGSTKSYLNEDVAWELGISGEKHTVEVNVINGRSEKFETSLVNFTLESASRNLTFEMEAQTTKNITGKLKPVDWRENSQKWPHLRDIKFPTMTKKSKVDLLIGLDYVELHRSLGEIQGEKGEPVARLTPLGWTCVGPIKSDETSLFTFHSDSVHQQSIDKTLQKFWEFENEGICKGDTLSQNDKNTLSKVEKSIQFKEDHYEVSLPWKETNLQLTDNYDMAVKRLESTERRLERDPIVKEMYKNTIQSYVDKDYVEKVAIGQSEEQQWFLPHFPVIRMNKETTKVRIVFDASARSSGVCLNDILEQGPKLQNSLFDVLMRFRKNQIALASDVQEMYLRVGISPPDRRFQRFLWRSSPEEKPSRYEFKRVVFGVSSSPFLAQLVSQHNANLYRTDYPRAAETVLESTYMDDSMDSVDNEELAISLYEELTSLWGKAGMFAHKWISNSKKVLEHIPVTNRALKIDLTKDELPKIKTLGVLWEAEKDIFKFEYNPVETNNQMTKRAYLKKIATLFDPLGLLAPYIIRAKLLMQDIWLSGIDWDQNIHNETMTKITSWFEELPKVSEIQIPRCLKSTRDIAQVSVHSFSDASERAYGAAVYARSEDMDGEIGIRLVAAKSKVTPIKSISIPRLELMAAVLSLELTKAVIDALKIDISQCTFWTDSMDVVCWLRNQSRVFKTFVANRVAEIQRETNPSQWRHIPGETNPADLVSRGVNVKHLVEEMLWWEGPEFLKNEEDSWPKTSIPGKKFEQSEIKQKELQNFEMTNDNNFNISSTKCKDIDKVEKEDSWRLDPLRYSSWDKLRRVMAWVLRFIENSSTKQELRKTGELTFEELKESEERLIRNSQKDELSEYKNILKGKSLQKNSKLLPLKPVIDSNGILRSNSRLQYADFLSFDSRYPIILPRHSKITELIVKSAHEQCNHSGTNHVLSNLSSKFWIIHGREVIREVENDCLVCKRQKAKPKNQIMAPLPTCRLGVPMKAFANISVDYGGPFLTVQGRGKSRQKRYLCLFTCLASRAVHLEMAYGLDTSSFLNAFFRMVSRRGLPLKVLSDNGTNFIGADKELKSLVSALDKQHVMRKAADKGIDWQFNPPLAPHWGGVYEIMIKAAKRAVYKILQTADVTDEELSTAFVGAESLINSRPLTYQTANSTDCTPLTPNHFLFGQMGGTFAPQSVDITSFNPLNRWRRVQELMRHFWQRWLREWLPSLASRKKWFTEQQDVQEGSIVLVVSSDSPRGQWPLGRILKVIRGIDGHIRSATVLVGGKEMVRPITKLCPLECEK